MEEERKVDRSDVEHLEDDNCGNTGAVEKGVFGEVVKGIDDAIDVGYGDMARVDFKLTRKVTKSSILSIAQLKKSKLGSRLATVASANGLQRRDNSENCVDFSWLLFCCISFLVFQFIYLFLIKEQKNNILVFIYKNDADTFSKPASGSDEPQQQQSGWFQVFSIAYYRPYFDVETADVMERIKDSLFPFKGSFSEKTSNNPDLYGPFWICTTLTFVAASIGTFVTYVAHKLQKKEWNYDVNLVTWSAGLFYGYVTVVPVGLYIILKYSSVPSGLVQLFCLYGYSLFIFIPALCLSVVPLELFRWVVAGVAGFMSATFVALNLRNHIKSAGERWFLIVTGIFLLQLALSIVLKLYLFTITV
ncbi:protein YIPF1 homolog [Camellia sinensis]|uniref:protein YIPF1 homolog n=1 Tax=Camellia sinensis TaxID=4442 RepID=UPI00103570FA|nr:protein YIPF1 homolog [Camellia sinensis]